MIKARMTGPWGKLSSITQKFQKADKIMLSAIGAEMAGHKDEVAPDYFSQLIPRHQRFDSAKKLQQFSKLVQLHGLTQKGFFLGIMSGDLHAWQAQFSQSQLRFLSYAAKTAGVEQSGVAILPPTPFGFNPDIEIDGGTLAAKFYKGLGLGTGGGGRHGGSRLMAKARRSFGAASSAIGRGAKAVRSAFSRLTNRLFKNRIAAQRKAARKRNQEIARYSRK